METEFFADDEEKPSPVPKSRWERFIYGLIVVVLPVVCFSLSEILMPEWQTGKFSDHIILMVISKAAWFFFPLLGYSALCMVLLLFAPDRFAQRFIIRFGVYTGCLLSLQYSIFVLGTEYATASILSTGFLIFGQWISQTIKSQKYRIIFFLLVTIVAVVLTIAANLPTLSMPILAMLALFTSSPLLCLIIGAVTTIKLMKQYELRTFKLLHTTGVAAWFAAYLLALRFSVLQAIELYNALPTSPPDCYIATASARGHQRFVGSTPIMTANGEMSVTRQLQLLKCAEIALTALTPGLHRMLRRVYDHFGPPLAHRLTHPFLADMAYLTLKPFEWAATLTLQTIIPEIDEYTRRFYSTK